MSVRSLDAYSKLIWHTLERFQTSVCGLAITKIQEFQVLQCFKKAALTSGLWRRKKKVCVLVHTVNVLDTGVGDNVASTQTQLFY